MDTINLIKQANEFGIVRGGQKLVLFGFFPTDAHAIGLQASQGIRYTTTFYWDLNDETRDLQKRFIARVHRTPDLDPGGHLFGRHALPQIRAEGRHQATPRRC